MPDVRFDECILSADYSELPILCALVKVQRLGHAPTIGWMRRLLKEANSGRDEAVLQFDYEKYAREKAERDVQKAADMAAKVAAAEARKDVEEAKYQIRLKRYRRGACPRPTLPDRIAPSER